MRASIARISLPAIPGRLTLAVGELPVEIRIVVRVHAALEGFRINGSVEESRGDGQGANSISGRPCGTDLIALTIHVISSMT